MPGALHIIAFVVVALFAASAAAQDGEAPPDPYLAAAVDALGGGDHELGLQLLEKAARRTSDPRITYYTAFALEKLGRCADARAKYLEAKSAGPERFSAAADTALAGFEARCVTAAVAQPPAMVRQRPTRRSSTLVTVGWVMTTVGALTLVALPVKIAFDREVATQSEQYFEQVYECDVDFGKLAADCDAAAVRANPQWEVYERRIITAKRGNVWMSVIGGALVAGGLTAVVVGSRRVGVAVVPTPGGLMLALGATW